MALQRVEFRMPGPKVVRLEVWSKRVLLVAAANPNARAVP